MVILAAGLGLWYLTTAKGERNEPIAFTQVPIGDSAAATIDAIRNTLAPTGPYDP